MKYRIATILAPESLSGAGTKVIDLLLKDALSALTFKWNAVSLGTVLTDHPTGMIDKVELIDGTDVLFSLTSEEMTALAYYNSLQSPAMDANTKTNYGIQLILNHYFGRKLWDTELAFDPKKFLNPQIKVTYDSDGCQAAVASGYLEVYAHCFDEKAISPKGFLMSKEFYTYTPSATDSHKFIDLPTDFPIRKMLLKSHISSQVWSSGLGHVKLSEDNDKKIPIDIDAGDLVNILCSLYPKYHERFVNNIDETEYGIHCAPDEQIDVGYTSEDANAIRHTGIPCGGAIHIVGATASKSTVVGIRGHLPFGIMCFPFGHQQDLADWYDVTKLGSLRADITAGAYITGIEPVRLALEQFRSY